MSCIIQQPSDERLIFFAINSDNPAEWGYTISQENGHFIPSTTASGVHPFRVHLFGVKKEGVHIPPELEEYVLVFHSGLDYVDYYRELSKLVSRSISNVMP